jgi:hypothetical protein
MSDSENTGEFLQDATNSATPMSADKKQAARGRKSYLKHRDRILGDLRAKYQKPERSLEWKAESHNRRSFAAKLHQKNLGERERQRQQEILSAGRDKMIAEAETDRLENQWDAMKLRLDGAEYETIISSYGSFNKINRWFRDADIPEGNPCKYDRAYAFTRGSAISLMPSIGCTSPEFARLLKSRDPRFRERRTIIWFNGKEKKLVPWEAKLCIALRKDVAAKLLADETVRGLSPLEDYNRSRVLVTLFPGLKREHKLVLETLPAVRLFLRATPNATEKHIANFIIERAREEKRGDLAGSDFRLLLRWLSELMPWIIAKGARISGEELLGPIAIDLVAYTCDCSRKIVRSTIYNGALPYDSREMHQLVRNHFSVEPVPAVKVSKKGGPPALPEKEKRPFTVGAAVEQAVPPFERFLAARRALPKRTRENTRLALIEQGFSQEEVDAGLSAPTAVRAARKFIEQKEDLEYDVVAKYHRAYLKAAKKS